MHPADSLTINSFHKFCQTIQTKSSPIKHPPHGHELNVVHSLRPWGHFPDSGSFRTFNRFKHVTAFFLAKVPDRAIDVPIDVALKEGQRSGPLAQHLVVKILQAKFLAQGLLGLVAKLH